MADTNKTYESDALIAIKNIANASIDDCKTIKNLADMKSELVKKVVELTENRAVVLEGKVT